jgi:hypothetical protein
MTPTMRQRRTKFIAKAMAFVWLFGFAIALANACAVNHTPGAAAAPQHQAWAHHATVDDPDASQACQPPCKGLCEAEQHAVAKTKGVDGCAGAQLAEMPGGSCMQPVACSGLPWRALAPPPPPGPPVAILFLRLTI